MPFSAISLIVCVCTHQTGPSHGLKRLEWMKWCCFYHSIELMKVSHWTSFGALTPPFAPTPPRKPHVHPYPPDGFIPQAGAFAPVWGCGRVGRALGWQPLSPRFDSRRGQFFLLSTHIWGYVAPKRDHSLSHPFVCEGYLDSAQPFALGAPRARIGARASWAEIPTDCGIRSFRY